MMARVDAPGRASHSLRSSRSRSRARRRLRPHEHDGPQVVLKDGATLKVKLTEYRVSPQRVDMKAGPDGFAHLTLEADNDGRIPHDLAVGRGGFVIGRTTTIKPGQTAIAKGIALPVGTLPHLLHGLQPRHARAVRLPGRQVTRPGPGPLPRGLRPFPDRRRRGHRPRRPTGPRGLTANALSSLSLEPLLVLVCFDKGARTLPAGARVAPLRRQHPRAPASSELSRLFASKRPEDEKFTRRRRGPSATACRCSTARSPGWPAT